MSLRGRTLLIVSVLMLATLGAVQLAGRLLVYPSFLALEQDQAQRNAERVIGVIDRELALFATTCEDWAYWDDTYQFATDLNTDYQRSSLIQTNQISLKINLLAFYDRSGKRLWARAVDFDSKKSFPLDEFSADQLPADFPLLAREDVPTVRAGLLNTTHGPMLAISAPILRSDRRGPRHGTLIMGRFLDARAIRRIAQQTFLNVELKPVAGTAGVILPPNLTGLHVPHTDFRLANTGQFVRADATLADLTGRALLDLIVNTPREVSSRGREALRVSMLSIALAGLGITAILLWLLNRSVLVPVSRLTRVVRRIGAGDDDHARLRLKRNDEIGELGNEFDRMLDRIADARRRLLSESYRSGANEMAGGVINDLREALGPLRERLEQPLRLLDRSQTASQQPLFHELNDPAISRHRQSEITQILQDQSQENAILIAEARSELRAIRKALEKLQDIVAEYSRFIASSSASEAIAIDGLIQQAQRKMTPMSRAALEIEVDSSVERAPPVLAAREILLQVINVLIEQAAKSRIADAQPRRQLRITASTELTQGRSMVHLRFDDNRAALDSEEIAGLFKRDDHPGDASHGLDLAWAENAILAMGGRLYAEASRPYDGLVLHLLLVRAKNVEL